VANLLLLQDCRRKRPPRVVCAANQKSTNSMVTAVAACCRIAYVVGSVKKGQPCDAESGSLSCLMVVFEWEKRQRHHPSFADRHAGSQASMPESKRDDVLSSTFEPPSISKREKQECRPRASQPRRPLFPTVPTLQDANENRVNYFTVDQTPPRWGAAL